MALALTSEARSRHLAAIENAITYTPQQVEEYREQIWQAILAGLLPISALSVVEEAGRLMRVKPVSMEDSYHCDF